MDVYHFSHFDVSVTTVLKPCAGALGSILHSLHSFCTQVHTWIPHQDQPMAHVQLSGATSILPGTWWGWRKRCQVPPGYHQLKNLPNQSTLSTWAR